VDFHGRPGAEPFLTALADHDARVAGALDRVVDHLHDGKPRDAHAVEVHAQGCLLPQLARHLHLVAQHLRVLPVAERDAVLRGLPDDAFPHDDRTLRVLLPDAVLAGRLDLHAAQLDATDVVDPDAGAGCIGDGEALDAQMDRRVVRCPGAAPESDACAAGPPASLSRHAVVITRIGPVRSRKWSIRNEPEGADCLQ
jgi:hypothetical protein